MSARNFLSDGRVAVTYEAISGIFRAHDHVPEKDRAPFVVSGYVTNMAPGLCKLSGFSKPDKVGAFEPAHMWLITKMLYAQGYRVIYIEREEGRRMVGATRITGGDFGGWWRVDIEDALAGPASRGQPTTTERAS